MTDRIQHSSRRLASRLAVAALLALGSLIAGGAPASAHVSVEAGEARQGEDDAVLTFRVPNERSGATTVVVDIKFPSRTPIASVKPAQKAGWTVTTKRLTLETPVKIADGEITQSVAEVVFRADSAANGIPADSFDTFQVLAGPLPTGVATLAFPTVQTYSNGQVSSWIEPTVPGAEPAHPAPVLTLGPLQDAGSGAGSGAGSAEISVSGASSASPDTPTRAEVRTARLIGLVGVVTGSFGMLGAGIAIGVTRRRPAPDRIGAG